MRKSNSAMWIFLDRTPSFQMTTSAIIGGKWSRLSEFVKAIKQTFSRAFNKRHHRRGTLWGERFKSLIVEDGETLINCLAYIDLNPIRAGIVKHPENYRWSSLGYHVQSGNKDGFLSMDFGLVEFGELDQKERLRRYRQYVYEAGELDRAANESAKTIDTQFIEKERRKGYALTRIDRFRHRTRYFTDSGIIGTQGVRGAEIPDVQTPVSVQKRENPQADQGAQRCVFDVTVE